MLKGSWEIFLGVMAVLGTLAAFAQVALALKNKGGESRVIPQKLRNLSPEVIAAVGAAAAIEVSHNLGTELITPDGAASLPDGDHIDDAIRGITDILPDL